MYKKISLLKEFIVNLQYKATQYYHPHSLPQTNRKLWIQSWRWEKREISIHIANKKWNSFNHHYSFKSYHEIKKHRDSKKLVSCSNVVMLRQRRKKPHQLIFLLFQSTVFPHYYYFVVQTHFPIFYRCDDILSIRKKKNIIGEESLRIFCYVLKVKRNHFAINHNFSIFAICLAIKIFLGL
jgi:hypothetical protein